MNTPTGQPEDLRAALTEIDIEFLHGVPVKLPAATVDHILRLCEAAALAALPEKWVPRSPYAPAQNAAGGYNEAIATAQANIHKALGGTGK